MKELKKRRELHNLEWEELVSEAESDDEKKHIYPVIDSQGQLTKMTGNCR